MSSDFVLGPYRIERWLGGGGFADVYLAHDSTRSHHVALKVLHSHHVQGPILERFQREGQQMLRLRHQHIVGAYDVGMLDGRYYIAMQYMSRGSLAELLAQRGRMDLQITTQIVKQVAAALDFVHPDLVHRDLKPSNVLFNGEGQVKVADFGIAHVSGQSTLTGTGQTLGTPHYMSPEQVNPRKASMGPATDIWALGVIVYQMACGHLPFMAEEPTAVLYQVMHEQPPLLTAMNASLPAEINNVVARALAKDPRQRYQRAGDMARDISILASRETPATSPTLIASPPPAVFSPTPEPGEHNDLVEPKTVVATPTPVPPPPRRRGAVVLWGISGSVAAVVLLWVLLRLFVPPAPPPPSPTPTEDTKIVVAATTTATPTDTPTPEDTSTPTTTPEAITALGTTDPVSSVTPTPVLAPATATLTLSPTPTPTETVATATPTPKPLPATVTPAPPTNTPVQKLTAPQLLEPTDGNVMTGSGRLSWSPVDGATTYRLQTRSDRQGQIEWRSWDPGAETSYTVVFDASPDYFKEPGTVYYWRVLALGADSQAGTKSAPWRFIYQRKSEPPSEPTREPTPPPPPDPTKEPTPPPP